MTMNAVLEVTVVMAVIVTIGCASHAARGLHSEQPSPTLRGVAIAFERFGQAMNPNVKLIDPDPVDSRLPGDDVWFRLSNASSQVITCLTESAYMRPLTEWDGMPDGTKRLSLKDGADILIVFAIVDARGHQVPYGGDFHFKSRLKSGTSVFFSVPREALENGRSIYVDFGTETPLTGEETNETDRVAFLGADLPAEVP